MDLEQCSGIDHKRTSRAMPLGDVRVAVEQKVVAAALLQFLQQRSIIAMCE